jgi:hypothetical protein
MDLDHGKILCCSNEWHVCNHPDRSEAKKIPIRSPDFTFMVLCLCEEYLLVVHSCLFAASNLPLFDCVASLIVGRQDVDCNDLPSFVSTDRAKFIIGCSGLSQLG